MNEQLLKDLVATAQQDNYNWDVVLNKFPELSEYDPQLLKDYIATVEKEDYNYEVANSKFPEFKFEEVEYKDVDAPKEEALVGEDETSKVNIDLISKKELEEKTSKYSKDVSIGVKMLNEFIEYKINYQNALDNIPIKISAVIIAISNSKKVIRL